MPFLVAPAGLQTQLTLGGGRNPLVGQLAQHNFGSACLALGVHSLHVLRQKGLHECPPPASKSNTLGFPHPWAGLPWHQPHRGDECVRAPVPSCAQLCLWQQDPAGYQAALEAPNNCK